MGIISAILIVASIINFVLGVFVVGKNRERSTISYGLLTISVAVWATSIYFFRIKGSLPIGVITYIAAACTALFFFLFSYSFTERRWFRKVATLSVALLCVLSALLSLTNTIIEDVTVKGSTNGLVFGDLYLVYVCYIVLLFGSGVLSFIFKYFKSTNDKQAQLKYIIIGSLISVSLATMSNLVLFGLGIFQYNWLGPVFSLVMIVFMAYAISKHHLFNIRVITTEVLVSLVSLVLMIDFLMSKDVSSRIFKGVIFVVFSMLGWRLIKSVLQEIERRKKMEKMAGDLQEAYDELKAVDEAKSEFIAMASHQLRTPLTIVKGLSSMLVDGGYGKAPEKFKEPLQDIFKSNERLVDVVNDLLNISKADLGKLDLDIESVDLKDMVGGVVEELDQRAQKKGLELRWDRVRGLEIDIDEVKMRQVVFNVIDNAIKYTEKGEVEVKLKRTGDKAQIIVSDTGEGMTKKEAKKIFDRFTRGRAGINRWIQGSGLGLYLARKYMDLHSGNIWAESDGEGQGSTFYIELPLEK